MSSGSDSGPLALAVLIEELEAVASRFREVRQVRDPGTRGAEVHDLLVSIDRYLRLETDVFLPALERLGYDASTARHRQNELRAALEGARATCAHPQTLIRLERAFETYRSAQLCHTFPDAALRLGNEAEGLAYELDEARGRMRGTYGV